jgi:holliday junction DNA helicase RuvA
MIEYLRGELMSKSADHALILCQGVGYGASIPLSTSFKLPDVGVEVSLWIHTYVREDVIKLFGFTSQDERQLFLSLLQISGVGPKVALAILSTLSMDQLLMACEQQDCSILEAVPGIGRRSAEKILVDLKNRLPKRSGAVGGLMSTFHQDLRSALLNLGFKAKSIDDALKDLTSDASNFEETMKSALRKLSSAPMESF